VSKEYDAFLTEGMDEEEIRPKPPQPLVASEVLAQVEELMREGKMQGYVVEGVDETGEPALYQVLPDGRREKLFPPPAVPARVEYRSIGLGRIALLVVGAIGGILIVRRFAGA
jgi:hypothetical protein